MKKTRAIFSYKLAREMIKQNCKLVDIAENTREKGIVFYFENSPKVEELIDLQIKIRELKNKANSSSTSTTVDAEESTNVEFVAPTDVSA